MFEVVVTTILVAGIIFLAIAALTLIFIGIKDELDK